MKLQKTCIPALLLLFVWSTGLLRAQSREGSAFDQSKYVPDIALILDVSGVARDMANEKYYSLTIPGFSYPFQNQHEFFRIERAARIEFQLR